MIPNEVLRDRIRGKRLSDRRFADVAGVSLKTVQRWLADIDHKVREDNARRAADVLGCTPHDLWPQQYPPSSTTSPSADGARPFVPTVYSTRTQMPISVWQQHFAEPQHSVDILVLAATFLFDTLDGFVDTLVEAAGRGVGVRMLVGDPDSPSLTLRGEEEDIGEAVVARCRTTVELLAPWASTPGLQIRTHQTTLYSSIFRVDDHILVNVHIYGSPGRNNPVMVFARSDEPRLWATFEQAFNRVWDNAKPLTDRGHPFP
jgi:transcriptional regulator with XRE-family HTH domain